MSSNTPKLISNNSDRCNNTFLSSPGVKIELNVKSNLNLLCYFSNIKGGAMALGRSESYVGHGRGTQTRVRKWLQGWAPVAAGTCVARVLGAGMTGDPAMLAMGCVEDIEVMPAIILEELTGVELAAIPPGVAPLP